MRIPEENEITISYNLLVNDGFEPFFSILGLDGEDNDEKNDGFLYVECNCKGCVISNFNERSVLLAVYEYLRQNGLYRLFSMPERRPC